MTVEFKLLFRVSGKMYYSLMVLRQWLMLLLLQNLCGKILYLLLDSRYLVEYSEMLDETSQGPKRNLIVLKEQCPHWYFEV